MVVHDETTVLHTRVLIGLYIGPLYETGCTGSTKVLILAFYHRDRGTAAAQTSVGGHTFIKSVGSPSTSHSGRNDRLCFNSILTRPFILLYQVVSVTVLRIPYVAMRRWSLL